MMTVDLIGEMLDSAVCCDVSAIVSAGFSIMTGYDVRCEIKESTMCDLYVTNYDADCDVKKLSSLALSIKTDEGDDTIPRFSICRVFILVHQEIRERQ